MGERVGWDETLSQGISTLALPIPGGPGVDLLVPSIPASSKGCMDVRPPGRYPPVTGAV